jgi:hypothetical protein
MIERIILIKLNETHSTPAGRAEVAAETRQAFKNLPGVVRCAVGLPADAHATKGWDLSIVLGFNSLNDVDIYRDDPLHRAFVDDYLQSRMVVIKAWNFEVK